MEQTRCGAPAFENEPAEPASARSKYKFSLDDADRHHSFRCFGTLHAVAQPLSWIFHPPLYSAHPTHPMMKRTLLYLVAGLAPLFSPLSAHADDCERFFQKWGQALHPGREVVTNGGRSATCKAWPANEALTLAVLPFSQTGSDDDEATFDLDILIADTTSGAIIAHTFEKSAIHYDQAFAIQFSGLSLDTARYQLAPGKRAFGVKVTYEHLSRAYPYEGTTLSLYVIDGQRIRKVLDRLTVDNSSGEWDANGNGHSTDTTCTLDVGPRSRNGYATLKITEKTVDTTSTVKNGQSIDKKRDNRRSITLEYRNGQYSMPKKIESICD